MMVYITVALPIYKSEKIAWLAMESLCRQEYPGCDWELIVCEDKHEPKMGLIGSVFFFNYLSRLKKVGCSCVKYISPNKWIPLANKWKLMAQAADATSEYFLLQGADDYSPTNRLLSTTNMATRFHPTVAAYCDGYAYNIKTGMLSRFHNPTDNYRLFMAIKTSVVREIKDSDLKSGVDSYLVDEANRIAGDGFSKMKIQIQESELRSPFTGVFTDGFNSISESRKRLYDKEEFYFNKTGILLSELVDIDIIEKLEQLRTIQ